MRKSTFILLATMLVLLLSNVSESKTITLESKNGIKFKASFYEAKEAKSPALLILPGRSGNRKPYQYLAKELQKANINALTISYNKLLNEAATRRKKIVYNSYRCPIPGTINTKGGIP